MKNEHPFSIFHLRWKMKNDKWVSIFHFSFFSLSRKSKIQCLFHFLFVGRGRFAVVNLAGKRVPYVTGADALSSSTYYPHVVISTTAKLITLKLIFVQSAGHKNNFRYYSVSVTRVITCDMHMTWWDSEIKKAHATKLIILSAEAATVPWC